MGRCTGYRNITEMILKMALTHYQTTKYLDWSDLKAFSDNKMKVTEELKFGLGIKA